MFSGIAIAALSVGDAGLQAADQRSPLEILGVLAEVI